MLYTRKINQKAYWNNIIKISFSLHKFSPIHIFQTILKYILTNYPKNRT